MSRVNGTAISRPTRIPRRRAAGKTIADIDSGGPNASYRSLYRGQDIDSIKSAFILPEVARRTNGTAARHTLHDREDQSSWFRRDARRPRPGLTIQF